MQFFKELLKAIEISLIGGNFKFHIDFTTTSNLLNLFDTKEEAKKKAETEAEEAKRKAEEERKKAKEEVRKEEEEEWEDDDWD